MKMEAHNMTKKNILIVDDEREIRELIKEYMVVGDFKVYDASDGLLALKLLSELSIDLVILDVMMPKMDGWSVCREIRSNSKIPIIMLSARGEEYDKLLGFELGVDDYVVKPFSPKELMARMRAVLTRTQSRDEEKNECITYGPLKIDKNARTVELDNNRLALTPKEYELIQFLMENPKMVFSREQLLTSVWGFDFYGDDRTVDTHIKMIREHLGDYRSWVVTVWGIGYKFEPVIE